MLRWRIPSAQRDLDGLEESWKVKRDSRAQPLPVRLLQRSVGHCLRRDSRGGPAPAVAMVQQKMPARSRVRKLPLFLWNCQIHPVVASPTRFHLSACLFGRSIRKKMNHDHREFRWWIRVRCEESLYCARSNAKGTKCSVAYECKQKWVSEDALERVGRGVE